MQPGVTFAVGYAPAYAYPASAATEADSVARVQLGLAQRAAVVGERLYETLPNGAYAYRGERFEEVGLAPEAVEAHAVARATVGDLVLALVASAPDSQQPTDLLPMPKHAPRWVTDLGDKEGGRYAVGVAPLYYYEHHAWLAAERQARQQLAFEAHAWHRQLRKGWRANQAGVTATRTAVELHGAQVVARWRNSRMCFVLMRAEAAYPVSVQAARF
jgi:hypothetical protein